MSTVIARGQSSVQRQNVSGTDPKDESEISSTSVPDDLGLGVPFQQKKFFWQRSQKHDEDAPATLPSVFDDPETAEKYWPRFDWYVF